MIVNTNSLEKGVYLMETLNEDQYSARALKAYESFSKRRGTSLNDIDIQGRIEKNLKNCNKMFKVTRTEVPGVMSKAVANFADANTILPNSLIKEVWTSQEGKEMFPEYFL